MKWFCKHRYEIKQVYIPDECLESICLIYSTVNSEIYKKFTIPVGNSYKICLKCGKIK